MTDGKTGAASIAAAEDERILAEMKSARGQLVQRMLDDIEVIVDEELGPTPDGFMPGQTKSRIREALKKRLDEHFGPANQT